MGPATNPRFAWMLVDRALVHYRAVRSRSHARRDVLNVETAAKEDAKSGIAAALPPETRGALDGVLQRILKQALHGSVAPDTERRMRELLTHVMDTEAT
jgi:hypothetical protein